MSVQKKAIMSQDRTGDDHQKARCFYCMEFWLMTMMVQFLLPFADTRKNDDSSLESWPCRGNGL